ncbi:MAG TPA: HAD-IA family hydrolase [Beijerinckiaceae bacterium]|nr:HAD-IA family hydrolase [Beijerinckiaceae bacterium]
MLIIYDCDGTLIDSEGIACSVCAEALTAIGVPYTTAMFAERYAGRPARETWAHVGATYGVTFPPGFNEAINTEIHARLDAGVQAVEGVRAAILAIDGARCVASSTGTRQLNRNLATAGLADLFGEHVFSVHQVKRGKPAPDVFLFAASQMGADPDQCLVIEDTVAGVTAARRAGMRALGFTGANHGGPGLDQRLIAAGASAIIVHMRDLPQAVSAHRAGPMGTQAKRPA